MILRSFLAIFGLFTFSLTATGQTAVPDIAQQVTPGRTNSRKQQDKPYVIMISADGFRYDFAKKFKAENLLRLADSGAQAEYLIPSFPSVTFPNHYTLVTGMYPAHHGLLENRFHDKATGHNYYYKGVSNTQSEWYGGTPLWVLAEQQQMLSAAFYWVGSEAPIKGIRPTYYYHYNEKISVPERINKVVNWLQLPAEKRPHFIALYFNQVDHFAHRKGPDAPETERAVQLIDSTVNALTEVVKQMGLKNVNFVFVSDHGMTKIPTDEPLRVPAVVDTSKFIISGEGVIVELYAKKGQEGAIESTYKAIKKEAKEYSVYLKTNMPAATHYTAKDDWHNYMGDIILVPHYPRIFKFGKDTYIDPGCHGYDPYLVKDMMATFYAWGPQIKKGTKLPPFENVDVYPFVTRLLSLKITEKIDGKPRIARKAIIRRVQQ